MSENALSRISLQSRGTHGLHHHQAKTHLSKLLSLVQSGSEVVITSGREKKPVAQLIAAQPRPGIRIGPYKDILPALTSDLFEPLPEEEFKMFEQGPI